MLSHDPTQTSCRKYVSIYPTTMPHLASTNDTLSETHFMFYVFPLCPGAKHLFTGKLVGSASHHIPNNYPFHYIKHPISHIPKRISYRSGYLLLQL